MKTFCISGPIIPADHYFLPHRLDYNQLMQFIEQKFYFVLHAPRQSGKTTAIEEFVHYLNSNGVYAALYINIEAAQAARDNVEKALIAIVQELGDAISNQLVEQTEIAAYLREMITIHPITLNLLLNALRFVCESSKKPIILFIDEIDSLIGDSLLSVLRQIRAGFNQRPHRFPQSLCLIGLRDVRDYRVWSKEQGMQVSTSSPFNIKAESLSISNFSQEEVKLLYAQHTQETGQLFTDDAIEYAFQVTQGQPWLVNALAYQACFRDVLDRNESISKKTIESAKEQLILRQDTHLDSLLDKLNEDRVKGIIDAIISGKTEIEDFDLDDIRYVRDLGLIKQDSLDIANPIYQEIIPRALTSVVQEMIPNKIAWYLDSPDKLNMAKLLQGFSDFFRENSDAWSPKIAYHESMPHIMLMAFLQRLINGSGTVHREYALGRRRVDLFVTWKDQKFIVELKIKHGEDTLKKGLIQTAEYVDLCRADEGHLLIIDRDPAKSWQEKISSEVVSFNNQKIHVWTL